MENKTKQTIIICATVVISVIIIVGCVLAYRLIGNGSEKETREIVFNESIVTEVSSKTDESANTTKVKESASTSTTPSTEADTKSSTDVVTEKNADKLWQNAKRNTLYKDPSLLVSEYKMYVFCTDTDVQDYVTMRMGPSTDFDIVETIANNMEVVVESKTVNGWTLCKYYDNEGWIRTKFLFNDKVTGSNEVCPGEYLVKVTGQYEGEPLNMRAEPTRESTLITKIPNGSFVIVENTTVVDGWIEVEYFDYPDNYTGYVLYKYLEFADNETGDKPVLYLYPEEDTYVEVKLHLSENIRFGTTYPNYKDGWRVCAKPDGTLINLGDNKEYSYLFWDLKGQADYNFDEGFVVKGEDTADFLQKTLSKMGLTPKEYNEFIVYWLPKMEKNPYNLISFQFNEYTDICKLEIFPKPDSMLRVFMAFKSLDEKISIPKQDIKPFERNGFTAVEWGGVCVDR